MQYDHRLDLQIISQIEKQGRCTFNRLKQKTRTNSRTLTVYLNALENAGIIVRKIDRKTVPSSSPDNPSEVEHVNDRFIGKKRYCYLTEAAKFEIKLGIPQGVTSRREKRNSKGHQSTAEKARLFYQLLLLIAPAGALRYRKKSKAEPGDIVLYDLKERRSYYYEVYALPGFGESDFLDDNIRLVTQFGGVFGHLSPSKKHTSDFFKRLQSFDPPLIRQIEDAEGRYKEARYRLADTKLEELISEIWKLYDHVYSTLKAKWKYLKKPNKTEYEWYRMFYGDRKASLYFTSLLNERAAQINDDRLFAVLGLHNIHQRKQFLTTYGEEKFLENYDLAKKQKNESEQRYRETIDQYPSIIRPMINEVYSPIQ